MMCSFVFYFAYKSHLAFKFEFESKDIENIKDFMKRKGFSISNLGCGLKPVCQPNRPGYFASRVAQLSPPSAHPLTEPTDLTC
jgi:hypothetical protein